MLFRSVNNVFYNPDTLYQPWLKPDGSGRKANSSITAAPWDGFSTALVPATFNLSIKQSIQTNTHRSSRGSRRL